MQKKPDPVSIRKQADAYYRDTDYYCSEAIVKTINDQFGIGYADSIIKLASGFPIGMGGSGCTCGAVAGGVMAFGMVFGRTKSQR
jgi:C_GCAxxG_C_C family probable redox protein